MRASVMDNYAARSRHNHYPAIHPKEARYTARNAVIFFRTTLTAGEGQFPEGIGVQLHAYAHAHAEEAAQETHRLRSTSGSVKSYLIDTYEPPTLWRRQRALQA
jgi:hypothetical protein